MDRINGLKVNAEYLPDFEWVRDIQYFDGPLTSEHATPSGDIYIFHWCDCSDTHNRWLAVRVSRRSVLELTSGLITIRELLLDRNQEHTFFVLDLDEDGNIDRSMLAHKGELPKDYFPGEESVICPELFEGHDKNSYPILIDGEWDGDELAYAQNKFMNLYSIILCSENRTEGFANVPWRGGFSAVAFYNKLKESLTFKPSTKALSYASPGYMEFYAKRSVSLKVKQAVDCYIVHKADIDRYFWALDKYLRDENLNKEDRPPLTQEQSERLEALAYDVIKYFDFPDWLWIKKNTNDMFKAAKIAKSFCSRTRDFAKLIKNERVAFAEI